MLDILMNINSPKIRLVFRAGTRACSLSNTAAEELVRSDLGRNERMHRHLDVPPAPEPFECVSTLFARLPSIIAIIPRRACDAVAMRSQRFCSAAAMIAV